MSGLNNAQGYPSAVTNALANVTSVFTRTGAVVATTGDYMAAQVTNAGDKASASAQQFTGDVWADNGASTQVRIGNFGTGNAGGINFGSSNTSGIWKTAASVHQTDATLQPSTDNAISLGSSGLRWMNIRGMNVQAYGGFQTTAITSGALSTISPSSGTATQVSTTRDVFLHQICTFNPTAGASATCKVEISPDNVTFSTLITVTIPAGITFDGTIPPLAFQVPAAWYVKFTTTNATLGTGTYY